MELRETKGEARVYSNRDKRLIDTRTNFPFPSEATGPSVTLVAIHLDGSPGKTNRLLRESGEGE